MIHKYLTCTGFGGTGSSVISDLMREYKNVKSCGADFEMSLAFDYGGLSDLQHYIVDDFERNKTAEGINKFRCYIENIKDIYTHNLGIDFDKIISDYLEKIVEVKFNGYYGQHIYRYNKVQRQLFYYIPFKMQRLIKKFSHYSDNYERYSQCVHKLPIELSADSNVFFEETRNMTCKLLDSIDPTNQTELLCFDQLVPAYNFKRYSNYFTNIKIIVVDRDPRDLYLLNKLFWGEGWIPSDDVDLFISWYRLLRSQIEKDVAESDNVLYIKFEDSIYNYEDTLEKIENFLELDCSNHVYPRKYFNPDCSINNTKLWRKYESYAQEVEKIKIELNSYIYLYK